MILEKFYPDINKFYLPNARSRDKNKNVGFPEHVTLRFPKEYYDKLLKIAEIENREVSVIARVLLLQALDKIKI